ncbi:hypothetical protein SYJ56_04775 [Algoriphagus sp. D3-2-R+10]|uniref:hypothetical protein n=1 Tax=Algoriphagus aurantiacus TaxID=3103948 RepID=UPI002B3BC829|nr:hypothetical protein [Algoriphagus sp. D3-2-R+10]MEB2774607.1 hypothetical protein [Algoriphagus sp. D3-2-R+10]
MKLIVKVLFLNLVILLVLAVSLMITLLISLMINSNHPFRVELLELHKWATSGVYIGYFIAIVTALLAFLFPISLTIVQNSAGISGFSSKEVSDFVFKSPHYQLLMVNAFILIIFSIQSFFNEFYWWQTGCNFILLIVSLLISFNFIKLLEEVISDFSEIVRGKEKISISEIIGEKEKSTVSKFFNTQSKNG